MNISYNAWKDYSQCPKKYFLRYRKKAEPTVAQNDYFKLYGLLTEKFFEMYCNNWRFKSPYMSPELIKEKHAAIWENILQATNVDWDAPFVKQTKREIFEKSLNDIYAIMDSEKQNYFLNTKSEVEICVQTKEGVSMTCRLDFIHTDPRDTSLMIFDGKGTGKIGKNIDKNQLLFYDLMHLFHFGRPANTLGFFYYQFNTLVPVEINMDILNEFRAKLSVDVKKIINGSEFSATPNSKACKYCDWRNSCEERIKKTAERRNKKPSPIKVADDTGICRFSF